ncbi:MAG TPA: hypothetical protein VME45_11500 [Stellaceae bacterium]|nr:hypothetical protein [Stellaceae bacterium]
MTKERTNASMGLWSRTARALGKLFAGVVSLPDDRRQTGRWNDYPTFPPY